MIFSWNFIKDQRKGFIFTDLMAIRMKLKLLFKITTNPQEKSGVVIEGKIRKSRPKVTWRIIMKLWDWIFK